MGLVYQPFSTACYGKAVYVRGNAVSRNAAWNCLRFLTSASVFDKERQKQ